MPPMTPFSVLLLVLASGVCSLPSNDKKSTASTTLSTFTSSRSSPSSSASSRSSLSSSASSRSSLSSSASSASGSQSISSSSSRTAAAIGTSSITTSVSSSSSTSTVCVPTTSISGAAPTVKVQHATVIGTSSAGIDSFFGIPFAQPPIGQLRLRAPQSVTNDLGTITATASPTVCPQQSAALPTASLLAAGVDSAVLGEVLGSGLGTATAYATPQGEDCLTLNVQRPSNVSNCAKLPVAVWIYGGGFEFGSTQANDASKLISTSVSQGKDIMYVAMNYRLNGFGFMPGKEIQDSGNGNIGLLDQRLALQWVADNIANFGGDPNKVTIFGESAGSISVFDQMALYRGNYTYNGKPLFRAAIMDSGTIVPADPLNCTKGQQTYDAVTTYAGCNGTADTLACLRSLPYANFKAAVDSVPGIFSYNSVALQYLPRPDGVVLAESPEILAQKGQYAPIPFLVGDQEDEGTFFSLTQTNITTQNDLVNYLKTIFFYDATIAQIETLVDTYPDDLGVSGSPFRTGLQNNIYPQYKRLAAILGDLTFTLTRRVFLNIATQVYPQVPSYSYLSTYLYGTPVLGTFHSSDVSEVYGSSTSNPIVSSIVQAYYISFFNTMDPNNNASTPLSTSGTTYWPQWSAGQQLLDFDTTSTTTIPDNFRQDSYNVIANSAGAFHI